MCAYRQAIVVTKRGSLRQPVTTPARVPASKCHVRTFLSPRGLSREALLLSALALSNPSIVHLAYILRRCWRQFAKAAEPGPTTPTGQADGHPWTSKSGDQRRRADSTA